MPETAWHQKTITLPASARGAHLVTADVERALQPELGRLRVGLLHLFAQHTSCALSLNENWDADVRADMLDALDRVAPEGAGYRHSAEGPDDMPVSLSRCGREELNVELQLGTCQVGARGRVGVGAH
jgi:secondary thiamine-phosphate synthase enzyme